MTLKQAEEADDFAQTAEVNQALDALLAALERAAMAQGLEVKSFAMAALAADGEGAALLSVKSSGCHCPVCTGQMFQAISQTRGLRARIDLPAKGAAPFTAGVH